MNRIIFCILSMMFYTNLFAQDSLLTNSFITDSLANNDIIISSSIIKTKLQADSAFMNNDYFTAIQIYEDILQEGEAAEIYYNLGNSYYKSGEIAKAILNYERALLLKPGNDDIRTNLDIARSKIVDKVNVTPEIFFIGWIKSLINSISMNAWARWGIVFFILSIVSFYFFIFSKQIIKKKISLISCLFCFIIVLCTNGFAAYQKSILINRNTAIIISPSVTIRSTPNESGTALFILHEGSKVFIKDNSMNSWKEISIEDGKVGWIKSSEIEII